MVVDLFDIDGTIAAPHGVAKNPNDIPEETVEQIHRLLAHGDTVVLATGAPRCLADKIGRVIDPRGRLWVAGDYGTFVERPGEAPVCTLPQQQVDGLNMLRDWLGGILPALSAETDDRDVRGQINLFWPSAEAWRVADEVFEAQLAAAPRIKALFEGAAAQLRVQRNSSDNSWNLLPAAAGKQRIVDWVRAQGGQIRVAAGDTMSDYPLLAAAAWPIATRHAEGEEACPGLVTLVQQRGTGHIACPHRPHGFGLADGIRLLTL